MVDVGEHSPSGDPGPQSEPTTEPIIVTACARTDVGHMRALNQDRFLLTDFAAVFNRDDFIKPKTFALGERGVMLAVCDGLGGGPAGEVAAELAVDVIAAALGEAIVGEHSDVPAALETALKRANAAIRSRGAQSLTEEGMGTTATVAVIERMTMFVAHVGDSRCYVLREGKLALVTRNHTVAADLVELGVMTPEEAAVSNYRNVLRQALGAQEDVEVALCRIPLRRDDLIMVCSDGLYAVVPHRVLTTILTTAQDLGIAAGTLVRAAFDAGAPDNITVLLARVSGSGLAVARPREPVSPDLITTKR